MMIEEDEEFGHWIKTLNTKFKMKKQRQILDKGIKKLQE